MKKRVNDSAEIEVPVEVVDGGALAAEPAEPEKKSIGNFAGQEVAK